MKKLIYSMLLALCLLSPVYVATATTSAADLFNICNSNNSTGTDASKTDVCKDVNTQKSSTDNPIVKIIGTVLKVLSYVTGVAAVIMIIVSGMRFMTAGGDAAAVSKARSALIYAAVGVVVTVMAQAIVHFVIDRVLL